MLLDTSGLQSDLLVVEARAHVPIHDEHQSSAQVATQKRTYSPIGKQNGFSNLYAKPTTKNQTIIQQTYAKANLFTFTQIPTNDKQPTNQNTGRCSHHARTTEVLDASENLVHWRPQNQGPKTQSTGEALHGRPVLLRFLDPKMRATNSRRKRNSSLDTSMAKPTQPSIC